MPRGNQVLKSLVAVLVLFLSSAVAKDCGDKRPAVAQDCVRQQSAQDCGCQPDKIYTPVQRQKPAPPLASRDMPDVAESEADRAFKAAEVLHEAPTWFLEHADAIAVIPGVTKAAFGFGGRWGKGLISRRDENGNWTPPSYIEIGGLSSGFQVGIQRTDLVLVFTDSDAVNSLLRGKLTLNAEAAAAAGPFGRKAEAGVPILLSSGILSFSHNKGLFAGISLDGSAITIDDSSNARVYGRFISGDEILLHRRVESNEVVEPFLAALYRTLPASAQVPCCN